MGLDQTMVLYPTLNHAITAMTTTEGLADRPAG